MAEIDALIGQQARQADAKFRLLDMDNAEKLAENYEGLSRDTNLSRTEIEVRRYQWGELYRETVGVPIERRDELRPLLEHLAETGDPEVLGQIERLQRQTQNGFSSALESGESVPGS